MPLGLAYRVIGMQLHLFVLNALPQALDEEVVPPGALAVHAELDPVGPRSGEEGDAGEVVAALVVVEDPRAAGGPLTVEDFRGLFGSGNTAQAAVECGGLSDGIMRAIKGRRFGSLRRCSGDGACRNSARNFE